jgi:hypothetical protein
MRKQITATPAPVGPVSDKADKPWWGHASDRFGSSGWAFATYEEAFAYIEQQYGHAIDHAQRFPTYQGILSDFRGLITGPDGTNLTLWSEYFQRRQP